MKQSHIMQIAIGVAKNGGLHIIGLGIDGLPYQFSGGKWVCMAKNEDEKETVIVKGKPKPEESGK